MTPPPGPAGDGAAAGGPVPRPPDVASGLAPGLPPSPREAELELRLHEESMRRQHAEARAHKAELRAEAAEARAAVLGAWSAEADEREARTSSERDRLADALRRGLAELGAELDALRLLATAGEGGPRAAPLPRVRPAPATTGPLPGAARLGRPAGRAARAEDPSVRLGELARGARELLAGGRLEAADEVIRGLEDAAARLRAQAPPPAED